MSSSPSIWHFSFIAHPTEAETAYREHFLDDDIRQLKISVYAITVLLIALNGLDLYRLSSEPALLVGIVVKLFFLFLGLCFALINSRVRKPKVMDLSVLIYTVLYAGAILVAHYLNDYSSTRITAIVLLFIFTSHIAMPVYAGYLLPAAMILILGETFIMFSSDPGNLGLDKLAILVVYIFAELMSVLASALYQQARFRMFYALNEVNTLSGFLPICSNCKSIRNDDGYYQQIEQYISERSNAEFSHGICPVCAKKLYGEILTKKEDDET
jgi:hypothetical protein